MDHLQASVPMMPKEFQQVATFDECDLRGIHDFRRQFVRFAGHRGTQSQNFAGAGDPQHQALTVFGANRQFDAAFTQYEDAARRTSLMEQRLAALEVRQGLDAVKVLQGLRREIAKDTIRAPFALKTASMMRCAFHKRCYRSPSSIETVTAVTNYRDALVSSKGQRTSQERTTRTAMLSRLFVYDALAIDFSAALLRISSVEPFAITI